MALYWEWKDKVGEVKFKNFQGRSQKVDLYQGNALLIAIYEYMAEDKEMYTLMWFFSNKEHMENCFGFNKKDPYSRNIFSEEPWEMLTFNEKMDNKDMITIIKAALKAFPNCKIHIESNALHREEGSEENEIHQNKM